MVTGTEIVRRALEEPLRQIAAHAGLDPSTAAPAVAAFGPRRTCGDLFAAGIFDPAMVIRSALADAVSTANAIHRRMHHSGPPALSPSGAEVAAPAVQGARLGGS